MKPPPNPEYQKQRVLIALKQELESAKNSGLDWYDVRELAWKVYHEPQA